MRRETRGLAGGRDPAVDGKHHSGEVGPGAAREEHRGAGHVVVPPNATQRRRRGEHLAERLQLGLHHPGRERAGAMALTVMCLGPSSLACTRVSWCTAALDAE